MSFTHKAMFPWICRILVTISGALAVCAPADAYRLGQRWTNTASGAVGSLGSPLTLTWGFAQDGSYIQQLGASNLIGFLDGLLGSGTGGPDLTQRPWFGHFQNVFRRWSELSGVSYVYEPQDDGQALGDSPGLLGIRADIRLSGGVVDGGGGVLAYNFFPNNGDMVLDTSESVLFGNPASNFLRLRNIVAHEHGHGLGLAHLDSSDSRFLMEGVLDVSFDGPQLDDIRGLHRAYGDVLEKSNGGDGNNTYATGFPLGLLPSGMQLELGRDGGPDTLVAAGDVDFVSIDDNLDADFFTFQVGGPSTLDVMLIPVGPIYSEGPRGGSQTLINAAAISDLAFTVYGGNSTTVLHTANSHPEGQAEQVFGLSLPTAGQYALRVTGTADDVQLYRLQVMATTIPEPSAILLILIFLVGLWRKIG